jgi:Spy/CpxP family protein refolding chaperone
MNKTAAVVLTASLLAGGSLTAMADDDRHERGEGYRLGCVHKESHHGHGRFGFDAERRVEHMSRILKLDEQQTGKVKAIAKSYDSQFDELRNKLSDNRKQMRELMAKDSASESDIRKLAETQGKLKADTIVLRARMQREIDQVLTKEQREKHREMREHSGRRFS